MLLPTAEKSYKTAGMSANEYMETVTGFSASLIQNLGGDTAATASAAVALHDISVLTTVSLQTNKTLHLRSSCIDPGGTSYACII